uniref:G_PROTEIN_RECEP_F1_2 domain-containing protein n=1 Tax=Steinernema glaseri TaxID=37863 RepID=A0A1I8AU32_9BILA
MGGALLRLQHVPREVRVPVDVLLHAAPTEHGDEHHHGHDLDDRRGQILHDNWSQVRVVRETDAKKVFKSVYLIMVFYICGWMTSVTLLFPFLINIAVVVVYTRAKRALQSQRVVRETDAKKVFKSVYLIMVFYICGWMTSVTLLFPVRVFITDIHLTGVSEVALSIFAASNLVVPFFVYYTQSPLYNREFRRLLRFGGGQRIGTIFYLRSDIPTSTY